MAAISAICRVPLTISSHLTSASKLGCNAHLHVAAVLAAGHSKWQNIRHIKAAKDGQKQKDAGQVLQRIQLALKNNPSTDPKLNLALANAIEFAKARNVPNTTIEKRIKAISEQRSKAQSVVIEAKGPSKSYFVINAMSASPKTIRNDIQTIFKKHGGRVGDKGAAMHSFVHQGIIEVHVKKEADSIILDQELAEELAINLDAEEVTVDGETVIFECHTNDTNKIASKLLSEGYNVLTASNQYIPSQLCSLTDKELQAVTKIVEKLDLMDDIEGVYHNISSSE